jgi:PAS domain S-box-containing protein
VESQGKYSGSASLKVFPGVNGHTITDKIELSLKDRERQKIDGEHFLPGSPAGDRRSIEQHLNLSRRERDTLQGIADSIHDGVIIMDVSGRIAFWNQSDERIFGYRRNTVVGKPMVDIIFPEDTRKEMAQRCLSFEKRKDRLAWGEIGEVVARRKDGRLFPMEFSRSRLFLNDQWYSLCIVKDVTDRKETEDFLRERETIYRTFFENSPDYCYMISPDGRILDINLSALYALGYKKEEVIGEPLSSTVYASSSRQIAQQLFLEWKKTGSIKNKELTIITKGGEERTVLLSAEAVRDNKGNILHSISIQRDITLRKKAEVALRESEKQYHLLFDTMLNGFAYCKIIYNKKHKPVDYVYVNINKAFEKLMGFKREDILGRRGTEVLSDIKDKTPELFEAYGAGFFRGEASDFEIYLETLKKWLHILAYSPVKDYFVVVFEDITERKKSEQAMIRTKNHLENVVNNVPRLIISFDKQNKVSTWNRTAEMITGYNRREIVGRLITSLNVFDNPQKLVDNLTQFSYGKKTEINELILKTKKGSKRVIQLPYSFIKENEIEDQGVLVVGKDVTYDQTRQGRLVQGTSYYISDTDHESAIKLFLDLVASGHTGLYITRTGYEELQSISALADFRVALLQQQKMEGIQVISDLEGLLTTIKEFSETNEKPVIFLDRVDYLFTTFSFRNVIRSLYQTNELIQMYNSLLLVYVNPSILDPQNLALVTEEFHPLPGKKVDEIEILDELYALLRFIYEQNQKNLQVSLKKIRNEFSISYPTVERRCRTLEDKGLICSKKHGRITMIYASEKGKALLLKTSIL